MKKLKMRFSENGFKVLREEGVDSRAIGGAHLKEEIQMFQNQAT
jgi:hypothetical protein